MKKVLTNTFFCSMIIGQVQKEYADVAELADALDSGSSGHYVRAGSSPVIRIKQKKDYIFVVLFCCQKNIEYRGDICFQKLTSKMVL